MFGCKRLCVDTGYYQVYNQPHVKLIDISKDPIERLTRKGVMTAGVEYEVDVIVLATGFAAMTGSFDKMNIVGRNGMSLKQKWEAGPRTYLGLSTVGFPNFFMITGPGSPSVLANMIQSIEQHADWMVDCMASHMRDVGVETIEPQLGDEDVLDRTRERSRPHFRFARPVARGTWRCHHSRRGRACSCPDIGGFPIYVNKCNEAMDNGYEGFIFDRQTEGNALISKIRSHTDRLACETADMDVLFTGKQRLQLCAEFPII